MENVGKPAPIARHRDDLTVASDRVQHGVHYHRQRHSQLCLPPCLSLFERLVLKERRLYSTRAYHRYANAVAIELDAKCARPGDDAALCTAIDGVGRKCK